MTDDLATRMTTRGLEDLIEFVHDQHSGLAFRDAAERELNRRGIETRQKHSGRLIGYELLRRELGLDDAGES